MSAQDRWSLAYFGHTVIKNGIKIARSIKRDTSHFAESQMSMDRQDLWALPTTMESLGICVRGLADAVELLIHPSAMTPAEVMDLYRQLGAYYERFDCRLSVTSLAEVFTDMSQRISRDFAATHSSRMKNFPRAYRRLHKH